jgi:hypothetical protein
MIAFLSRDGVKVLLLSILDSLATAAHDDLMMESIGAAYRGRIDERARVRYGKRRSRLSAGER